MAEEREVLKWITVNGAHVPIYADEPTSDEKKKDRQIEENKKQADEKNGKTSKRPSKPSDYKLSPEEIKTLRIRFEGYDSGVGAGIAKKLVEAEQSGKGIKLSFKEKDFIGYMFDSPMTDAQLIAFEKLMKKEYKEMFDDLWKERGK